MKHLRAFIISAVLALQSALLVTTGFAANTNLISNASAETTSSNSQPSAWQSNAWGSNTTSFAYKQDGHTGTRSLYTSMSTRTSGDAKWMHDAVAVTANTTYTYSSWYKSSIATEIDVQYVASDGTASYAYVKSIPAATDWTELSVQFTTPSGTNKAVVMHIVADTGWLQTDDFSLMQSEVVPPTPIDNDNLIANASFESANTGMPVSWAKNTWGTNSSTFTYESTGRTGSRSITTRIASYGSGDAKWFATPASIVAGKSYQYSDYYKSSVGTRVVAAFVDANGVYTYQELPAAPIATAWSKYTGTFTAPSTASTVSIYHLIDKVGYLTLDDVALSVAVPPSTSSLVSNPSLETANGSDPADWIKSQWGNNNAAFSYVTDGHTGTRSAKVTMSSYVDGDAKWYFNPIQLNAGQQYRFTSWYKGSVAPHAVAMFLMADGSERYFGMPLPQGSPSTTTWQKYTDTFSVPAGAVRTSVFMYINQNGWIQTDDYSIDSYHPNGFTRPLVTLTFDDGHEDNATTALPVLKQYNLKSTQCYATSFIEGQSQAIKNGVLAFKNAGHEICSHTVTHPFLTQLGLQNLDYELSHSKTYLQQLTGQPVKNFATPYGDYNAQVVTEIKKYYSSHRSVDEGYNSKDNFNIYNLRVQNILDTTTSADVAGWVANAKTDKTWLILVYHRVATNPGPYDTTPTLFKQQLQKIASGGVTVKTTQAALDEILPQL